MYHKNVWFGKLFTFYRKRDFYGLMFYGPLQSDIKNQRFWVC